MKSISSTVIALAGLLTGVPATQAQFPTVDPSQLHVINPNQVVNALPSRAQLVQPGGVVVPKLQIWQYQYQSPRDGNTYAGSIVGGDPFKRGARTATIPVVIIPIRFDLTGPVVPVHFDSTAADDGILGVGNTAISLTLASDQFMPTAHTINGVPMGNTTFQDAFQRASFWPVVQAFSPAYHLAFNVSVVPKVTVTGSFPNATIAVFHSNSSPSTNGGPPADNSKGDFAVIDINGLDPVFNTIIGNLGIQRNQFPLFVLYGAVMSFGDARNLGNCCILGYHNGSGNAAAPGQTYGVAEYDQSYLFGAGTKNTSVLSHELSEWINDPSVGNIVPPWGNLGQVSGCQNNLETGDPLSGTLMPGIVMPNGVTYYSQECAFFSWFLGTPFAGAGGRYSSNGTFGGFAKLCPPGGTN